MDHHTIVLGIIGATILAVTHALDKKLPRFATLSDRLRVVLSTGLGIGTSLIDAMVKQHLDVVSAFWTSLAVSGPAFVVIFVSWLSGGDVTDTSGKGKGSGGGPVAGVFGTAMLCCAFLIPGCTKQQLTNVETVVDTVLADAEEGASYLSAVESLVHVFFLAKPNPELEATISKEFAKVHLALQSGISAVRGVKNITRGQQEAAFADFINVYNELEQMLTGNGIANPPGAVAAVKGKVSLPQRPALLHKSA